MPKIQFKNSTVSGSAPSSLQPGELAVNITDQKMWIGNSSNTPVPIVQSLGNQDYNNVSITGGTVSVSAVGNTSPASVATSSLSIGGNSITQVSNDSTLANANYTNNASNSYLPTQGASKGYSDSALMGRLKNIYTFTSSGTYTKSGTDVNILHVIVVGAGGGGTSYNIGGGAGGYAEGTFNAATITTVPITVGTGTSGSAYYANIGAGGTTSFGSFMSASGGYGADANYAHASGHGGYGFGGNLQSKGGTIGGHSNNDQSNNNTAYDATGGVGYFGNGAPTYHGNQKNTSTGAHGVAAWGAGGSTVASSHNGQGGFAGQSGICIIYEYK